MIRIFRHYVPAGSVFQFFLDILFLGAIALFVLSSPIQATAPMYGLREEFVLKSLLLALAMGTGFLLGGLYEAESPERSIFLVAARSVVSFLFGAVTFAFFYWVMFPFATGSAGFFGIAIAAFPLIVGGRLISAGLRRAARPSGQRVLVLGTGQRAFSVQKLMEVSENRSRVHVSGYLQMGDADRAVNAANILPPGKSLSTIVKELRISEIIVALMDRRGGLPLDELMQCRMMGVRVTELSSFFERETGSLRLDSVSPGWMIHSDGFEHGMIQKRIFDILASLVLLVVSLPIMAIGALMVYLEDGAPIIYRQERTGQYGRSFVIYKFRSMRNDAEKDGRPKWASKNDSRITRVGRILRKLRIDELPQIFNVLKGDMSFVGPRPERPFFVKQLCEKFDLYQYRHNVKPGITGWAQVCFSYGDSIEDSAEKLQYDLYYVKNHSLFLDVVILMRTVRVVLFGKGAQ